MSGQHEPKPVRIVDFAIASSAPLKIDLDDGTRLVVQLIPVRVIQMGITTPDGQPTYRVNFQQIMDQIPADDKLAAVLAKKG